MVNRLHFFAGRAYGDSAAQDERAALLGTAADDRHTSFAAHAGDPTTVTPAVAPSARSAWLPRVTSSPGFLPGDAGCQAHPSPKTSANAEISAPTSTSPMSPPPPEAAIASPSVPKRRYLSGSGAAAARATHMRDTRGLTSPTSRRGGPAPLGHGQQLSARAAAADATPRSRAYAAFLSMRHRTIFLINLVSIMERMDEQIVPALSRPLGCAFRAGPHQLGLITFARALVQAVASPLGGLAGHFLDRVTVLFFGCAIWGFFCTAFSFATTVNQGILAWAFNGVGLSLIIPNSQSLVADYYTATQRGEAFGTLMLTGALGGMLGTMFATNLGGMTPLGMAGWRVAFMAVGAVSLAIGAFTLLLAVDPTRQHYAAATGRSSSSSSSRGNRCRRKHQRHQHHAQQGGCDLMTHGSAPAFDAAAPALTSRRGSNRVSGAAGKADLLAGMEHHDTSPCPGTLVQLGEGSGSDAMDGAPSCFEPTDVGSLEQQGTEEDGYCRDGTWSDLEEQPLLLRSTAPEHVLASATDLAAPGDVAGEHTATASPSPPASPTADTALGEPCPKQPLLRRYQPSAHTKSEACRRQQMDDQQHRGHQSKHPQELQRTGYGHTQGMYSHGHGSVAEAAACGMSKSVPADWRKGLMGAGGSATSSGCGFSADEVVVAGCAVEGGGYESAAAAAAAVLTSSREGRPALTCRRIWEMITTPTFLIIILQGIVGSTPWNALVFLTLYLQLIGFSDATASSLMALLLGGTAAGALVGGWLGDRVAEKYPHHGRVALVQFSVGIGVPLAVLMMRGLPMTATPATAVMYGTVMLLKGVLTSWAAPACNNPLFAEIVPPDMRNLVYAFDRSFEGAISALGAPLVGMVAERWFGFTGVAGGEQACEHHNAMDGTEPDLPRARALGDAMLLFMAVPWTMCTLFYTGLHWSYPRDRARALRPQMLDVSEGPGGSRGRASDSVLPYKAPAGGAGGSPRGKADV